MCNIISILAHLPHGGEEPRDTMLRAPSEAGASRVMAFLGPALRRCHVGDIRSITLDRNLECFHLDPFTLRIERCRHNLVDEELDVLSIVRGHPVANTSPQLRVDEITSINASPVLRVAVVHQVQVISSAFTCIA
jgi:hypothetical protein